MERYKYYLKYVFGLIILLLVYKVIKDIDFFQIKRAILSFRVSDIIISIILVLFSQIFVTLRFMTVFNTSLTFITFLYYYSILGISFIFGSVVPGGAGSDFYKIYYFQKKRGIKKSISIVLESKFWGLMGISLLGMGYFVETYKLYYYGALYLLFFPIIFLPTKKLKYILKNLYFSIIAVSILSLAYFFLCRELGYDINFFRILGGISLSLLGKVIPIGVFGINLGAFGIYYFLNRYMNLLPADVISIITVILGCSYIYSLISLFLYNILNKFDKFKRDKILCVE